MDGEEDRFVPLPPHVRIGEDHRSGLVYREMK